jgi:predicted phosphate transport protein (TIGR00153 family)
MMIALDTATNLESAIKAVSAGENDTAKKAIERLFQIEEEIDDLRRTVFEELTKGSLPTKERQDIMHLVKNLDRMADHVKDSARNVLVLAEIEIPNKIWQAFHGMATGIVQIAAVLGQSLRCLLEDPSKARKLSEKVEDEENKVDQIFLEIKSLLLKFGEEINPAALLLLKDLLDAMEEAADSCADTGDYLRILTVTFARD